MIYDKLTYSQLMMCYCNYLHRGNLYLHIYHQENNIGPLVPIVEHNRLDIVTLATFFNYMFNEACSD